MLPDITRGTRASPAASAVIKNWREPFSCTSQNESWTKRLAFIAFEMLAMVNQQNAVASSYPKYGEKADQ